MTSICKTTLGVLLAVLGVAAQAAGADNWTCKQSGLTREVTLFYPDAPATLPCEVYYSKPSENRLPKRLWSARNDEGYCRRKALEFVSTLEGLGWSCAADRAESPIDAPAVPRDDQGS